MSNVAIAGVLILGAYLLGSIPWGYIIGKFYGVDVRTVGSKNIGATNVTRTVGRMQGKLCFALDFLKGGLPVMAAQYATAAESWKSSAQWVVIAVMFATIVGHIFPVFLKFKGGKGFASYVGMTLALNWRFALVVVAVIVAVTLITDYLVAGTMTTIVLVPVSIGFVTQSVIVPLILLVATAVITYKHRENFVRMYNGTEIGLKSTIKGEHKRK